MKGISAVIATILMLVITIGLASVAYTYFTGIMRARTMTIELVDAYCYGGDASWIVRNTGTADISAGSISGVSVDEACTTDPSWSTYTISAGDTITVTATGCSIGRTHVYRMIGPSNAIELSVYCG
jgi:flagellin-like protein